MRKYCMKCMRKIESGDVCPVCGNILPQVNSPHILPPGTILNGRYLVGNALGQGGFGITYVCRDLTFDIRVAIKEYFPSGYANRNVTASTEITISNPQNSAFIKKGLDKFLHEARILAEFHDTEGVVNVINFFSENNTAYIVMEYLDGITLQRSLRQNTMDLQLVLQLMEPVMDSLERIHAAKVFHRDISPDNLILLRSGKLKLIDFGAARQVTPSGQASTSIVVKAGYAPLEQFRSDGGIGPWTDIYALCATIYECITGRRPDNSLDRAFSDHMKWPRELGIPMTASMENVLKKGMAISAESRFQSVAELREAFRLASAVPESLPGNEQGTVSVKDQDTLEQMVTTILSEEIREKQVAAGNKHESTMLLVRDAKGSDTAYVVTADRTPTVPLQTAHRRKLLAISAIAVIVIVIAAILIASSFSSCSAEQGSVQESTSEVTPESGSTQAGSSVQSAVPSPSQAAAQDSEQDSVQNSEQEAAAEESNEATAAPATDSGTVSTEDELETIKNAEVGDTVTFGTYEQDNDTSNGQEAIEWKVLEKDEDRALVISTYALDSQMYDTEFSGWWEESSLRTWLNFTFYNAAFTDEQKSRIMTATVTADDNPDYPTYNGNDTEDKVFLLSVNQAEQYFNTDTSRVCKATPYAQAQGADITYYMLDDTCWWWLRTAANGTNYTTYVMGDGSIYTAGNYVEKEGGGVRPAMWISLSADGQNSSVESEAQDSTGSTEETAEQDTSLIDLNNCQEMMVSGLTTSYLGLRSSPENADNEIGSLHNYSRVKVVEKTNDDYWYVYAIDDDQYGYVTAKYLTSTLLVTGTTTSLTLPERGDTIELSIPSIQMSSDEILNLNTKIREEDCTLSTLDMNECWGISYVWYVNGDTLSLVVKKEGMNKWWDYFVYNISVSQETVLSDEAFLSAFNYTEDQLVNRLKELVTDYITDNFANSTYDLSSFIEESTTEENLKSAKVYANQNGDLCAWISYKVPAGGGSGCRVFNLNTGELLN